MEKCRYNLNLLTFTSFTKSLILFYNDREQELLHYSLISREEESCVETLTVRTTSHGQPTSSSETIHFITNQTPHRFFEAYLEQGISFWGVTPQNEPTTGSDPNYSWQTLFFDAQTERFVVLLIS